MEEKIFYYNNYYINNDEEEFSPLNHDEIYSFFNSGNSLSIFENKFNYLFDSKITLKKYFMNLVEKRIIIDKLPYPSEIFKSTVKFSDNNYPVDYFFDQNNLTKFKETCKCQKGLGFKQNDITLAKSSKIPDFVRNRHSVRNYKKDNISFQDFSDIVSILCEKDDGNYFYPSAGALYPNEFYIDIKNVESLEQGCYKLNPINRKIRKISDVIGSKVQYFANKEIYNKAPLVIYISYNAEFNIPKYREYGYMFGMIETGICSSYLTLISEYKNLGSCILGIMDFEKIEKMLKISSNEHILEAIAIGKK